MLSLYFHQTFIPERRLIAALLDYAAAGKEGTLKEISSETGIPMGKSSGKTPAILDYACGMGLIELVNKKTGKKPLLTSFGKIVYKEDKFIGEKIIQWLAHMNLCRSDIGATAWRAVFAEGRNILGASFLKNQLEDYLISVCGPGKERTGPMIQTYLEDAAMARAGVLGLDHDQIERKKAPILDGYAIAYSAYILSLLENFFLGQNQVTITDFNEKTLWFDICLWNQSDIECLLTLVELKNFISIDRQMQPWIIEKKASSDDVWPYLFDEIA